MHALRHDCLLAATLKTFIVSARHSPPRRHLLRVVPHGSQLFCPCFELGLVRRALQPCYTLPKVTFLWKCEWFLAQKPSALRKFWFLQTPENFQKENLGLALRMTIALDTITSNNIFQKAEHRNKKPCVIWKETKVKERLLYSIPTIIWGAISSVPHTVHLSLPLQAHGCHHQGKYGRICGQL